VIGPEAALSPQVVLALDLVLFPGLGPDGQGVAADRDVNVLGLDAGDGSLDHDTVVGFVHVHSQRNSRISLDLHRRYVRMRGRQKESAPLNVAE
jgi:hypothetical protein